MRKSVLIILIFVGIVAIAGPSIYFYSKYTRAEYLRKNPTEAAKEERKNILEKISKLTEVPSGEEPTIATISDMEKLANQPLFANAKNGDTVIFFPTSKRAIIYRQSINKIIDIMQMNINDTPAASPAETGAPSPSPKPVTLRVALYNGTTTPRLTSTVETAIKEKMPDITVTTKTNAASQDYNQSIVVDLSGTRNEDAVSLAEMVNGNVVALPEGETKPDADILIIIGKSYK